MRLDTVPTQGRSQRRQRDRSHLQPQGHDPPWAGRRKVRRAHGAPEAHGGSRHGGPTGPPDRAADQALLGHGTQANLAATFLDTGPLQGGRRLQGERDRESLVRELFLGPSPPSAPRALGGEQAG